MSFVSLLDYHDIILNYSCKSLSIIYKRKFCYTVGFKCSLVNKKIVLAFIPILLVDVSFTLCEITRGIDCEDIKRNFVILHELV